MFENWQKLVSTEKLIVLFLRISFKQKVSLPDRANIGKIIPTTYVSRRESLRSEIVRKEIPTYIDSLCRPPSKPPDKQNSLESEISKKILPT